MATDSKSSFEISDITTCSICLETFKVPKALPCIHTFCLQCLDKHCEDKEPEDVTCPLCRKVFTIPPGGNNNLPNNFFILQLLQVKQSTGGAENKKSIGDLSRSYCDQHPAEQNGLYCYDCNVVTCPVCIVEKHRKHDLSDVKESAEKFHKQLENEIVNVSSYASQNVKNISKLEIDTNLFRKNIAKTRSEIFQKYDHLQSLITSQQRQLMADLDLFEVNTLKEVKTVKNKIEIQCLTAESFLNYCQGIKNQGSACHVSRTAHDLHVTAEELAKTQCELDCDRLCANEITFKPSLSTTDAPVKNFLGVLVSKDTTTDYTGVTQRFDLTQFLQGVTVCHEVPGTETHVCGITVLGGHVFVARAASRIYVYNSDDFAYIRSFTIRGSMNSQGLVSCAHYNCLYVSDPWQKLIYRHDLTKNVTTSWGVGGVCHRLSITKSYNILATLSDKKVVEEYRTDGSFVRAMTFDISLEQPYQCIQLSTGNYVLFHSGKTKNGVCIVDRRGKTILSYDRRLASPVRKDTTPAYLAVDIHDNVLVAYFGSHRMQLLSSTLTHLGDIVMPIHLLNTPSQRYTLYVDELNHRLLIELWGSGCMLVLDVNNNDNNNIIVEKNVGKKQYGNFYSLMFQDRQ